MANPEGRHGAIRVECEVDGVTVTLAPDQLRPSGAFVPASMDSGTASAPRGDASLQPIDAEIELILRSPVGEAVLRALVVQVITLEQAAQSGRKPGYGVLFLDLVDDQRAFIGLTLDALDRAERAAQAAQAAETRRRLTPTRPRPRIPSSPLEPPSIATRKRKLCAEGSETLRRLQTELQKLPARSPFAVLGLEQDADAETARLAYLTVSKRYHPHVYARFDSEEINTAATDLFIAYKRAYTTVRSSIRPPKQPSAPTTTSAAPRPERPPTLPPPAAVVPVIVKTEVTQQRHSIPVKHGPSPLSPQLTRSSIPVRAPAVTSDRPAQTGRRAAVDADMALSAALKHLAGSRFDQAELELERLCEQHPEHRDSQVWLHVCRARRLKAARRPEAALDHYRAVLAIDPEHREAIEHVGRGKKRGGGLVGKWFSGDDE